MASTYEPIATTTLGTAAISTTFSSIPSTYTDLRLIITGTSTDSIRFLRFNSQSTAVYSFTTLDGDGTNLISSRVTGSSRLYVANADSATYPSLNIVDIFSYAGSTNKTVLSSTSADANGTGRSTEYVGLWRNTAAITTILVSLITGTFGVGTTFTLYGIKAA